MSKTKAPKAIYRETYKKGSAKIMQHKLPWLSHIHKDFECNEAYIMEAGKMDDGREYQVIKVFLKEKEVTAP